MGKAYQIIISFLMNLHLYIANEGVQMYMRILDVNYENLKNPQSKEYHVEIQKFMNGIMKNPCIFTGMIILLKKNRNMLEFLNTYSDEQFKYITYLHTGHTKLIACPGSGKTRSIISRAKFMVQHGLAKKDEVFAITFSRFASIDFHNRIKDLFPDYEDYLSLSNFSTIDSLAKSILCRLRPHKSENVEILSISFKNFLKDCLPEDSKNIPKINKMKHLFVDEAQDLNEVQYDIICLLRDKFSVNIHLIGDPNQNIYQFRRSSDKYLMNFSAKEFKLTHNYRSTQEIINFFSPLRPINTGKIVAMNKNSGPKVKLITAPINDVHNRMIEFLKQYNESNDLCEVAIICPTKGFGSYENGLSVIFNMLKTNNIKVNQLYDESGMSDERKKKFEKTKNHVNLITYHGTKGLEFDVVFVMDFNHHLFNIKPAEEEHTLNRYLLYVACSRAKQYMFVCTYLNVHTGYMNHWLTKVNPVDYSSVLPARIPVLGFREMSRPKIYGITELIAGLSDIQLDSIHDMLTVEEASPAKRIFQDFTKMDRCEDEALYGQFVENLFYLQYELHRGIKPHIILLIESMIKSQFVFVPDEADFNFLHKFINENMMTWERYDEMKNILPSKTRGLIEKYFTRERELNEMVVCNGQFADIIAFNLHDIKKSYERYRNPKEYDHNYENILLDFFYLNVIQYAYYNKHYFYMNNHGKEKQTVLYAGLEMYECINKHAKKNFKKSDIIIKDVVKYSKLLMIGEIDYIEQTEEKDYIVEIKCVKDISIKYYIQLLLYNFCYYGKMKPNRIYKNEYKIVNFLTGLEHHLRISIDSENMFRLLTLLAEVGDLSFSSMNLVYDLETTGKIEQFPLTPEKPDNDRAEVFTTKMDENRMYYGVIYPEITEITIKDYETHMTIINKLVKPKGDISLEAQEVSGILPDMVMNAPNLEAVRNLLKLRMERFIKCTMMAHNGACFDHKIMKFDKMIDLKKVSFLDTMSVIPIHCNEKLQSKSVSGIYYELFKKEFNAHRSEPDVDALIKIMKKLKIEF